MRALAPGPRTRSLAAEGAATPPRRGAWPWTAAVWAGVPVGFLAAVVFEGIAAPHQSHSERLLLGHWLRFSTAGARALGAHTDRRTIVGTGLVLLAAWLVVAAALARRPASLRVTALWSAAWSLPFALGVPILSRDGYAYLAQGEVARRGYDPYRVAVQALGEHDRLLRAVDPLWRHTVPPYGPLGLRAARLAAEVAHAVGAPSAGLMVLRALAVAGVAVTALCVVALALPERRALALWLVMSPLTLLHLIGAMHLEAMVCGLLTAAVLAARRGRIAWAFTAAAVAASVKVTAAVLLIAVALHRWRQRGRWLEGIPAGVAAGLLGAAATVAVMVLIGWPDPFGWVRGLATPKAVWDPLTLSSALSVLINHAGGWVGLHPGVNLLPWLRLGVLAVGAVVGIRIVWAADRRELSLTAAYLAADIALCGPVLWPWYLAPVAALLLTSRSVRGWMAAVLCGTAPAIAALPVPVVQMQRVAYAAEAVGVTALVVASLWVRQRRRAGNAVSPAAGRAVGP